MEVTHTRVLIAERYELGPLLRRGGMAEVHAGTDRRLERSVAIKLLRPDMADRDDVRLRFESEARAAARLSHPNAVAVFDTGEHEGQPYIVMERLPGRTLADVIADGPVDPEWLIPMAAGVLSALGAAHAAGIVHRDVKAANILLTADGSAKIADFGIAKSAELVSGAAPGVIDLTLTGQLIGTPAYLAPERLAGAPATFLSDLYSMAVVLYEALAGTKPFAGSSFVAVANAVQAGTHVPLAEARPGLDPAVVDAVERAMDRDPSRRFASAEAMALALTDMHTTDAPTTPLLVDDGEETTLLATPGGSPTQITAAAPLPLGPRRVRVAAPLLAAVALVVGVLLLLVGASNSSDPRTTTTAVPATTIPAAVPTTVPTTAAQARTPATNPQPRPHKGHHGKGG